MTIEGTRQAKSAVCAVRADQFARTTLAAAPWTKIRVMDEGSAGSQIVGLVDGHPVEVEVCYALIGNFTIAFWSARSDFVSWSMCEAWAERTFAGALIRCDARDFLKCVQLTERLEMLRQVHES